MTREGEWRSSCRIQLKCDGTRWRREGEWRGNCRMEWVASTLHTTLEHGSSSITTADAHTSAASSRLNWHPRRFKWTRPFRRKTISGFCTCAITFRKQSTYSWRWLELGGKRYASFALPQGKSFSANRTGGWVCSRAGLDGFGEERFLASVVVWTPKRSGRYESLHIRTLSRPV
jgi:hypothetical protein